MVGGKVKHLEEPPTKKNYIVYYKYNLSFKQFQVLQIFFVKLFFNPLSFG